MKFLDFFYKNFEISSKIMRDIKKKTLHVHERDKNVQKNYL